MFHLAPRSTWCETMRADLICGPCPGFGFRKCLHCKKTWLTTTPDTCVVTNRYCPNCVPLIAPVWRGEPERRPAEERIKARMAELRRRRELSVPAMREEIGKRRRTA